MEQWKVILATMMIFGSGVGTGHLISHKSPSSTLGPDGLKRPEFQPKTSGVGRNNSRIVPVGDSAVPEKAPDFVLGPRPGSGFVF